MDIFADSAGISAADLKNGILLSLASITAIFAGVIIRSSYLRWLQGELSASDLFFDVVLLMIVTVFILML